MKNNTARYLFVYSGAIGEATLGVHVGRVLATNLPGAQLELVSTRPNAFVRELVAGIPFVRYRELSKENPRSWLALLSFIMHRYKSTVYETVTVQLPLWWRILFWCARRRVGSVQIRYQMHGHERPVPQGVTRLVYTCQTENLFETQAAILTAWGIPVHTIPAPALARTTSPYTEPYLLFHFFAGNYRRSIPVDHSRAILVAARKRYPTHRFFVTCAVAERDRAGRMCEGVENVQIESRLSASEVVAILSGAAAVIGTASGIIFLAAQLSIPTVSMSCLVDPCWLPTYSPAVKTLAARDECRCNGDKTGTCVEDTPEGEVFRCLFFISTEEVIAAIDDRLSYANKVS
jgi:ADP-heptose:LPS heptosyltransferase